MTPETDECLGSAERPPTLLGWLQSDIAANAARPHGRSHDPADRSVQVHRCHGPARQVQVLREVLLGLLARLGDDSGWRRRVRLGLGTGVLGGYTTYSTFAVEVVERQRDSLLLLSTGYALASLVCGVLAAAIGLRVTAR